MSTTFNPALLSATDRMRFTLGDTNVNLEKPAGADPMLLPADDDVYLGVLAMEGNDERAATLAMAEAFIAKYALEPTKADISEFESAEWRTRLDAWKAVASRLRGKIDAEVKQLVGTFSIRKVHRSEERTGEYYAGLYRRLYEEW